MDNTLENTLENTVIGGGDTMNTASAATLATTLQDQITASNMFSTLTPFVTIIGTMILVSLAFYFLRKIIKKASKGKAGI